MRNSADRLRRAARGSAALAFLATLLTACGSGPADAPRPLIDAAGEGAPEALFDVACEDPRPEVCTRDYRPVCGLRDSGIRCITTPCEATEWRTYGNACDACADPAVFGYVDGECADGGPAG